MAELQFVPSQEDPNWWHTDGHGHHPDSLHHALGKALDYWPGDHPTQVPDGVEFREGHVGLVDLVWRRVEEVDPEVDQVKPVTWAILVPEPPEEEPDLDPVTFPEPDPRVELSDRLVGLAGTFGRVAAAVDLHVAGTTTEPDAVSYLIGDLRDLANLAHGWAEALTDGSA